MIKKQFKLFLSTCLLVACSSTFAITMGNTSPGYTGKIRSFSARTKTITMDGKSYQLAKGVSEAIYPLLIKGTIVRYRLLTPDSPTIEMIWINASDN